jgi:hypothetical protein
MKKVVVWFGIRDLNFKFSENKNNFISVCISIFSTK